jgi:hypothetical protein
VQERAPGEAGRRRLLELLTRYRANVLEVADTLVALRGQCGIDPDDLPDDDDDVRAELARIRAAHEKAERAGEYRQGSAALAAAAEDALDYCRHGGDK